MKIKNIKSFHRFNYIEPELSKISPIGATPIHKLLIMDCDTWNIVIDMRDGLAYPSEIQEDAREHKQYIQKFPNKPYVYCKVAYSPTQCLIHHELADANMGHIITCPKFSLYNIQKEIFKNRIKLRKNLKPQNPELIFMGQVDLLDRKKRLDAYPNVKILGKLPKSQYQYNAGK